MPDPTASANLEAMPQSELDNFTCPEDVREHAPEAFYKSAVAHARYVSGNLAPGQNITPECLRKLIAGGNVVVGGDFVVSLEDPEPEDASFSP